VKRVTVQSLPDYSYTVLINDGRHASVSDEAESDGGDDLGPSPYELLLSALGSCTAITLLMYARRKQWPLYEVSVSLSHDKIHPRDCAECTDEERAAAGESQIDLIHCDIAVRGDLDQEQVERLLDIAHRCPVHRTLLATPKIVATIVPSDVH
jgi:putative redox protein